LRASKEVAAPGGGADPLPGTGDLVESSPGFRFQVVGGSAQRTSTTAQFTVLAGERLLGRQALCWISMAEAIHGWATVLFLWPIAMWIAPAAVRPAGKDPLQQPAKAAPQRIKKKPRTERRASKQGETMLKEQTPGIAVWNQAAARFAAARSPPVDQLVWGVWSL